MNKYDKWKIIMNNNNNEIIKWKWIKWINENNENNNEK